MDKRLESNHNLAAGITKSASKQTYYTIRFFVDRDLVNDAYRAYAYFRWVDDVLDEHIGSKSEKTAFIERQRGILEALYQGNCYGDLCAEEMILAELASNDTRENPGLYSYLSNMMVVMEFDASRQGRLVSQGELDAYTNSLAAAVTDAMSYFIGHHNFADRRPAKYYAVIAAHITHMLRDAVEDNKMGYFNIPQEYLQQHGISADDVDNRAYRQWVCGRVKEARGYFKDGRGYLSQVTNKRRRLAGYAYTARIEWMLNRIERDNYCLRSEYHQRKSLAAGLWMGWSALTSMFAGALSNPCRTSLAPQPARTED